MIKHGQLEGAVIQVTYGKPEQLKHYKGKDLLSSSCLNFVPKEMTAEQANYFNELCIERFIPYYSAGAETGKAPFLSVWTKGLEGSKANKSIGGIQLYIKTAEQKRFALEFIKRFLEQEGANLKFVMPKGNIKYFRGGRNSFNKDLFHKMITALSHTNDAHKEINR